MMNLIGIATTGGDAPGMNAAVRAIVRTAVASVEFLLSGKRKDMTGIQGGHIVPVDLEYACTTQKPIDERLYRLAVALAT